MLMLDKLMFVFVVKLVLSNMVDIELSNLLIEIIQFVVVLVDHHHNKHHHQVMDLKLNLEFLLLDIKSNK
jgi:hypothetical protein